MLRLLEKNEGGQLLHVDDDPSSVSHAELGREFGDHGVAVDAPLFVRPLVGPKEFGAR